MNSNAAINAILELAEETDAEKNWLRRLMINPDAAAAVDIRAHCDNIGNLFNRQQDLLKELAQTIEQFEEGTAL